MSQLVGNPSAGIGGVQLGLGLDGSGQVVILFGTGAPSAQTDPSVTSAAVGSLYLRLDGGAGTTLYVRETASTWTAK
jgi:hypothetical protein